MTSCVANVNPDALGDFFLLDVLFMPVLGVDEFVVVDLRFLLVLGARGVSAARKTTKLNSLLVQLHTFQNSSKLYNILKRN